jgi:hypothetical protein
MNGRGKGGCLVQCWNIIGIGIGVFVVATSEFGLVGEANVVSALIVGRAKQGLAVRRTKAGDVGRVAPEVDDGGPGELDLGLLERALAGLDDWSVIRVWSLAYQRKRFSWPVSGAPALVRMFGQVW